MNDHVVLNILHVIHDVSGGAGREMLTLAAYSTAQGMARHSILSLKSVDTTRQAQIAASGLSLFTSSNADQTYRALAEADIVQVHFWNTPELYTWLQQDLPPIRLLLRLQIGGKAAPQVITSELAALADQVAVSAPYSAALHVFASNPPIMIFGTADLNRVSGVEPQPHCGFNVGYIGTVDFIKMHPDFVNLCARIPVLDARFIVCGHPVNKGTLLRQAEVVGLLPRFELRGFVEDLCTVLSELDVFGYPLCVDNYAASELVLHEVMAAGIPAVILNHGGAVTTVKHDRTGYIVSEDEYPDAVAYLLRNVAERKRLGEAARDFARQNFGAEKIAPQFQQCYEAMRQPKRSWRWRVGAEIDQPPLRGAALFIASLGDTTESNWFRSSAQAAAETAHEADAAISSASPVLRSEHSGGIFHYRNAFPKDALLRLWSGLALLGMGQNARALSEFKAAAQLGMGDSRLDRYSAQAAANLSVRGGLT